MYIYMLFLGMLVSCSYLPRQTKCIFGNAHSKVALQLVWNHFPFACSASDSFQEFVIIVNLCPIRICWPFIVAILYLKSCVFNCPI